jgi:hypothetical protein
MERMLTAARIDPPHPLHSFIDFVTLTEHDFAQSPDELCDPPATSQPASRQRAMITGITSRQRENEG